MIVGGHVTTCIDEPSPNFGPAFMRTAGWANIPPKTNRKATICFSPGLYKKRNLVERFFNKLKYYRRIATRYDKLACIRLCLRHYETTAWLNIWVPPKTSGM